MLSSARLTFAGIATALVLLHCGGNVASEATRDAGPEQDAGGPGLPVPVGDAGAVPVRDDGGVLPGEAGACEGTPHGSVPAEHRPTPVMCPRSAAYGLQGDAGPSVTCATDADCVGDAAMGLGAICLQGICGWDACLTDADCSPAQVCVCASQAYGGNGFHGNECVAATCKVDGDCGAGRYCAPSRTYCGSIQGYNCTSPADSCVNPQTDCASCGGNTCDYAPQVGHFVCGSSVCNG